MFIWYCSELGTRAAGSYQNSVRETEGGNLEMLLFGLL